MHTVYSMQKRWRKELIHGRHPSTSLDTDYAKVWRVSHTYCGKPRDIHLMVPFPRGSEFAIPHDSSILPVWISISEADTFCQQHTPSTTRLLTWQIL